MADYYPLLARAVSGLETNTAETRRAVYERARQAIVKQLRSYDPPLSESEITRERLSLEEAVRKIESEARSSAPSGSANPPAPPPPKPAAPAAPVAAPPSWPPAAPSFQQVRPTIPPAASQPFPPPPDAGVRPVETSGMFPPLRPSQPNAASAAVAASQGAVAANTEMTARADGPRFDAESQFEPRHGGGYSNYGAAPPDGETPAPRSRLPAIAAIAVILALAGLGAWAYFARDQLAASLGSEEPASTTAPKIADRVGEAPATDIAQPPAAGDQVATAPADVPPTQTTPPDPASLVGQRAILYEEAPDQQGGNASNGSIVWRTENVPGPTGTDLVLRGEVTIPDRNVGVTFVMQRNTDPSLPASHTIDIQFSLPPDFPNAGIGSVPGILFKPSEEAGGAALAGLSVKVTNNFFLVGLSGAPKDRADNLKAIREQGWIDIPLLYENGRRAVLTIEKGVPGEAAFTEALAAWDSAAAAQNGATGGVPQQ